VPSTSARIALLRAHTLCGDNAQSVVPTPWAVLSLGRASREASGKKPACHYSLVFQFPFFRFSFQEFPLNFKKS
jgi:hypothetical protein